MNTALEPYLAVIRAARPALDIITAELNTDGMANAVVVVNDALVFRFPKTEAARDLQRYETTLLGAIHARLPVVVPQVEVQTEDFAQYRLVPGEPLYRHRLLSAAPQAQAQVLAQLGAFLAALHTISLDGLPVPPWQPSGQHETARSRALARLKHVQQQLYPHLWRDQWAWVEHLYAPVMEGTLDLDGFTPCLIHADLASYHLLIAPDPWRLSGVIDFGTARPGDPAVDIGLLLNTYGEGVVRRMAETYPMSVELLDRARFFAGSLELEWALAGVRENNVSMLLVHLGRARDIQPIGTR
jgi:aminoglycoside phosphotransferase (APT) family kinase protein